MMSTLVLSLLATFAQIARSGDLVTCHWRQTGGCSKSGPREPKHDLNCDHVIANGASGFCDCNGDGIMDGSEIGYDCKDSRPKDCNRACEAPAVPPPVEATPAPTPEATQEVTEQATQEKVGASQAVAPNPASAYQENFQKFNVMKTFKDTMRHELENSKYPPLIAAIALALGLVLLFNGERSFNGAVTFSAAVVFGIIAKQAILDYWQEHNTAAVSSPNTVANIAGLEVGAVVAIATHYGNKGMLVAIGAGAGFFVANFLCNFMVANFNFESMLQVEYQVVWYSLCCLAASVAVYKDKHLGLMAWVSPIPGGAFTASAVLYFATEAFVGFGCKHTGQGDMWDSADTASCPYGFTPRTAQWINFFTLSFDHTRAKTLNEDVGIFYNNTFNFRSGSWTDGHAETQGYMILVDHIVSVVLWILLTAIGIRSQRAAIRKQHATSVKNEKLPTTEKHSLLGA